MDVSCVSNFARKPRSSTFGAYESCTKDKDFLSHQAQRLVVSPIRSVVSRVCLPARQRSSTWHGAALLVNELHNTLPSKSDLNTAPSLKDTLCKIITEELNNNLKDEKDLKSSQEFIERSALLAKVISTRARQVIRYNAKVVSFVFIGEVRGDGIEVATQCILEPSQDSFASGNFKSPNIFAVGTLFVTTYDPI